LQNENWQCLFATINLITTVLIIATITKQAEMKLLCISINRGKIHTTGKKFAKACIPQFQKKGAVPNRALTVGTPNILKALFTSGKFLE